MKISNNVASVICPKVRQIVISKHNLDRRIIQKYCKILEQRILNSIVSYLRPGNGAYIIPNMRKVCYICNKDRITDDYHELSRHVLRVPYFFSYKDFNIVCALKHTSTGRK